jgi:tetratricopeptide (TPR) repeat protein
MMRAARKPVTVEPGPAGAGAATALVGERVAFTGRFATLKRTEAESLVTRSGGTLASDASVRPTILVVGMLGWPLMHSGQVTRKLAEAERLRAAGKPVRVISETQFREMVGLDPPTAPAAGEKTITAEAVCAALGIDGRILQRWEHCGLVRSQDGRYDFRDLLSLRTVTNLVARGVSPVVIRKSLDALAGFLPGVDRPLAQLNILVSDSGELVAELEEALLTQSGQLELRFDAPRTAQATDSAENAPSPRPLLSLVRADARDSAAWVEAGLEHERAGDLIKAEHAYRRAAALAPSDPVPQFNLGNVLLSGYRLEAAAERYAQAVALDPSHSRAWFNLAHVQDALKDRWSAIRYLRRAIAADPGFADAYYNLADLAERAGDRQAAADAWDDYLRLDPGGPWSAEARRRLAALRGRAWA